MRRLLLALILSAGLSGCFGHAGDGRNSVPLPPTYVYVNVDGSCWADDVAYARCPWNFDGPPGYYYYWEGEYIWDGDRYWGDRLVPPPRHWIARPMNPHSPSRPWRAAPWPRSTPPRHYAPPTPPRHRAPPPTPPRHR